VGWVPLGGRVREGGLRVVVAANSFARRGVVIYTIDFISIRIERAMMIVGSMNPVEGKR
jgi:hypothetical protein